VPVSSFGWHFGEFGVVSMMEVIAIGYGVAWSLRECDHKANRESNYHYCERKKSLTRHCTSLMVGPQAAG
jgi:hypothetical protein